MLNNLHMVKLMSKLSKLLWTTTFFINETRPTRNKDSDWLQVVLDWMVEVVMNGIDITRDQNGAHWWLSEGDEVGEEG
jgi:hypothetical protein